MDLTLDEQTLIVAFRALRTDGRKELLDYAVLLRRRQNDKADEQQSTGANQCSIDQEESRPETAKEPIFTE